MASAAARSIEAAAHDQRGGRSIGEPAAPHQLIQGPERAMVAAVRRRWGARRGPMPGRRARAGWVRLAGQLAGHRQGGPLAAKALLDLEIGGVVRGTRAGGAHGRLVQRPAQHRGALAGQVAAGALAVRLGDGDVQAGEARPLGGQAGIWVGLPIRRPGEGRMLAGLVHHEDP